MQLLRHQSPLVVTSAHDASVGEREHAVGHVADHGIVSNDCGRRMPQRLVRGSWPASTVLFVCVVPAVAAMTTVLEEMDDRARQEQQIRDDAEHMCAVLLPEEEGGDCDKQADADHHRSVAERSILPSLRCGAHAS